MPGTALPIINHTKQSFAGTGEAKEEIKVKNISQGIYFVRVIDGEKSYCKKLIVE